MLQNLQEYYRKSEEENIDVDSFQADLTNLIKTLEPTEVFHVLIENDLLENDFYFADELHFWSGVQRYKIDKLNFSTIDELVNAAIIYLKFRNNSTSNTLLKAKYNQILWYSPLTNKFEYGKASIDNYLEYIQNWIVKYDNPNNDLQVLEYLTYLQKQCKALRYRFDDFNSLITQFVNKYEMFSGWFIYNVVQLAYDSRGSFDKTFNEKCIHVLENVFNSSSQSVNDDIYSLALKYGTFLKLPVQHWHNLMGHFYYETAKKRKKGSPDFLIPEYYGKAIRYFELAKNEEMAAQLNKEFPKIKSENPLTTVQFNIPVSSESSIIMSMIERNLQENIEAMDTEKLINFLSYEKTLMCSSTETSNQEVFLQFAKKSNYDINNNFNHSQTQPLINPFQLHLKLFTIKSVGHCLKYGIESNQLSFKLLIQHFETNSWFGNTEEGIRCLELLKPGINSFFNLFTNYLSSQDISRLEFVLPLDSLATKMEGVLRTFAQLNGINPTKVEDERTKGNGDVQTREIFIHELLSNEFPNFKSLFDKDEYQFFKTVYLKDGYNIRNNIAHSFYKLEDYTMDKLLLVILSIIRISKHKIISSQNI